jgi:2-keto-3-deoxy-L-rhamnonate aldolase RhmA
LRNNRLLELLREGEPAFGTNITIPDLFVVELMSRSGADFVVIESEHSPLSNETVQKMLIALGEGPATRIVRVPAASDVYIKQSLDAGSEGVIVPSVNDRFECEAVVAAALYAPKGRRGFGPRRASRLHGDRADYLARANDQVAVLPMIETAEAIANLDEILSVPGVSGVVVGPGDLAVSMGHIDSLGDSSVEAAIRRVLEGCESHGVPFGIFASTPAVAEKWLSEGAAMVIVGSDVMYLDAGIARTQSEMTRLRAGRTAQRAAAS